MTRLTGWLILALALLPGGCPPEDFPNAAPTTLAEIDDVRNNEALSNTEIRQQLRDLGLSDATINALLRSERTANQFGGDERSAYAKVSGSRFTELTPDEIQIYGDSASDVDTDDDVDFDLTDDEAQAIADFFDTYSINSSDQLEAVLDEPGNTVPTTIPDGVLRTLFVEFDPELLLSQLP